MKAYYLIDCALCVLLLTSPLSAQTTMLGGSGLLRINDAESLVPGQLGIAAHYLGYYEAEENSSNLTKDVTINSGFTLGLSEKLEITAGLTIYQDDNHQLVH